MVNQDLLNRLLGLIKQRLITTSDIKIQEYKDAVQALTNQ